MIFEKRFERGENFFEMIDLESIGNKWPYFSFKLDPSLKKVYKNHGINYLIYLKIIIFYVIGAFPL